MNKHLLIIYHSQKGHTQQLAIACKTGAESEKEIEVSFKKAFETNLDDVLWADGIVIATPEYFGTMSGAVKDFFDRTYYPAREQNVCLPYCLLVSCENDGSGAERNIETIANGYILKKTLKTLIIKEDETEQRIEEVKEFGQTFAAGMALGIF